MSTPTPTVLFLITLAGISLGACGKPNHSYTGSQGEGSLQNAVVSLTPEPQLDPELRDVTSTPESEIDRSEWGELGASAACPATRLSMQKYKNVATAPVPKEVGRKRCVTNVHEKIAAEVACASQFNDHSFAAALEDAGLDLVEREKGVEVNPPPAELGEIYRDRESGEQRLLVGMPGGGCDGVTSFAFPTSEPRLATDASGALWVVKPLPRGENRRYFDCRCFPGCGIMPRPEYSYLLIEPGETVAGTKILDYDSLWIVAEAVDHHHACGYAP